MTDYTDLIARLRADPTWLAKEAADAIAALQAEVARLVQQTTPDIAQAAPPHPPQSPSLANR